MHRYIPVAAAVAVLISISNAPAPAQAAEKQVVEYRLTQQRTIHLDDEKTARQFHSTLQQLHCESKLDIHDGHIDLTYRCRDWRRVEFNNHATAHKWERWLKALAFEVRHIH